MKFTTTFNYPDYQANTALSVGENGQTSLTGTSQTFGMKLNVAW